MPKPPNTFKEYPLINDAYGKARKVIRAIIDDFNDSHPDGLGYWAPDPPVMDFVQSCIPEHLNPAEVGASTLKIQQRIRDILYPYLASGAFTDRQFASWLEDEQRATAFTTEWMRRREPKLPRGEQPRIGLEELMNAGILAKDAKISMRIDGKDYQGIATVSGKFKSDMGFGLKLFRSPNDAVSQTFNKVFNQWKFCTTTDENGKTVSLDELRKRYKKLKKI